MAVSRPVRPPRATESSSEQARSRWMSSSTSCARSAGNSSRPPSRCWPRLVARRIGQAGLPPHELPGRGFYDELLHSRGRGLGLREPKGPLHSTTRTQLFAQPAARGGRRAERRRARPAGPESGLDEAALAACLGQGAYLEWPGYVTTRATAAGVSATPTVLVAGTPVSPEPDAIAAAMRQATARRVISSGES